VVTVSTPAYPRITAYVLDYLVAFVKGVVTFETVALEPGIPGLRRISHSHLSHDGRCAHEQLALLNELSDLDLL
jgi:hypothetical protein